jgi:UMP-CMP kinase
MSTTTSSSSDTTSPAYNYHPPTRISDTRSSAAIAAALPRARISTSPTPRVVFVLGGPGAGKGTQCARLVDEYKFVHLSAGDLLREERKRGGPHAELIERTIRNGQIVPVEVTVALLQSAMLSHPSVSKFLVDGFPRNWDNIEGWQRVVGNEAHVDAVLQYDVPDQIMTERLLERGKSSGRSDDNEESIRKRLVTYREQTLPGEEEQIAMLCIFR